MKKSGEAKPLILLTGARERSRKDSQSNDEREVRKRPAAGIEVALMLNGASLFIPHYCVIGAIQ
jgi:hypothetical protein